MNPEDLPPMIPDNFAMAAVGRMVEIAARRDELVGEQAFGLPWPDRVPFPEGKFYDGIIDPEVMAVESAFVFDLDALPYVVVIGPEGRGYISAMNETVVNMLLRDYGPATVLSLIRLQEEITPNVFMNQWKWVEAGQKTMDATWIGQAINWLDDATDQAGNFIEKPFREVGKAISDLGTGITWALILSAAGMGIALWRRSR